MSVFEWFTNYQENIMYFVAPFFQYLAYVVHKLLTKDIKTSILKDTPIDLQLLFYGVHISYLLANQKYLPQLYSFVFIEGLPFVLIFSSFIFKQAYSDNKNILVKSSLSVMLWGIAMLIGLSIAYTMIIVSELKRAGI